MRGHQPFQRRKTGEAGVVAGDLLDLPSATRQTCRLERWDARTGEPGAESLAVAFWAARRMALGYKTVGHMLTLAGGTGTGKTHLALAIAWEWVERFEAEPWALLTDQELREAWDKTVRSTSWQQSGTRHGRPHVARDHGVRFARVGELLDLLQGGYEDGTYFRLMQECQTCRLLVLDDLGHQRETPWRGEIVDRIIDARYIGGRCTVVSTNLTGDQLPPRVASRLRDRGAGFVATMGASDYRPRKPRLPGARSHVPQRETR